MIEVGSKVKVIKLIPEGGVSMPYYAIGNTYQVADIQDNLYRYGLIGVDNEGVTYFREEELELENE